MVVVNLVLLATLLIVVILEGFNWFAIWTAIPMLAVAVFAEFSLSLVDGHWARLSPTRRFSLLGLIAGVVVLTLYAHLAMFFGAGDGVVEPSARLLQYMLASVYAVCGGGVGYAVGYYLGWRIEQGA